MNPEENSSKLPFKLSKDEKLITEIKRSYLPYFTAILGPIIGLSLAFVGMQISRNSSWSISFLESSFGLDSKGLLVALFFIFAILSFVIGVTSAYVYYLNRMFITNEHIVRIVQYNPFRRDVKIISHLNIEDVKASQGFFGILFRYGALTLSTEGQNATYQIKFVKNPFDYAKLATDTRDSYEKNLVESSNGGIIPAAEKR